MLNGRRKTGIFAVALVALAAGLVPASALAGKSPAGAKKSVIGGRAASLADWGFTAAIVGPRGFECTGSVIAPTRILTAAHCIDPDPTKQSVITGRASLNARGGQVLSVASAVVHPAHHDFAGDMAVLTLKYPTRAPVIPLATLEEDRAYTQVGAPLQIAGFGVRNPLAFGKPRYGTLTTSAVTVKPSRGCGPMFTNDTMICNQGARAGTASIGRKRRPINRQVCFGDSGGPLIGSTPNGPRLFGVADYVSTPGRKRPFGFVLCGLRGYSAAHARVAPNLSFIRSA